MTWHQMAMILAMIPVLGGCHAGSAPSVTPRPQARDAAVYATVFDSLYPRRAGDTVRVIALHEKSDAIPRATVPEWVWTEFYTFPGIDSTTAADLERRSTIPFAFRSLGPALEKALGAQVMFLAASDFTALHRLASQRTDDPVQETKEFWKAFYQAYPARWGSVSISAIGYRRDGRQAVLHVQNGCGGLCGRGQIVLLEKVAGKWKIIRIKTTSVS